MKSLVINCIAIFLVSSLFKEIYVSSYAMMFLIAIVLTLLNATIKPVLKFLSFPVNLLSFGLFSLVINALVLQMAFVIAGGSYISSFGSCLLASILISIVNSIFSTDKKK